MKALCHFIILTINDKGVDLGKPCIETADTISNFIYFQLKKLFADIIKENFGKPANDFTNDGFAFVAIELFKILMFIGLKYKRVSKHPFREEALWSIFSQTIGCPGVFVRLLGRPKLDALGWLIMLHNFSDINLDELQQKMLNVNCLRITLAALRSQTDTSSSNLPMSMKQALRILLIIRDNLAQSDFENVLALESGLAACMDGQTQLIILSAFDTSKFFEAVLSWLKNHSGDKLHPLVEIFLSPISLPGLIELIQTTRDFFLNFPNKMFLHFLRLFTKFKLDVPLYSNVPVILDFLFEDDFAKIMLIKVEIATRLYVVGLTQSETVTAVVSELFSRVLMDSDFWPIIGYAEIIFSNWAKFQNKSLFTLMFRQFAIGTYRVLDQWSVKKNSTLPQTKSNFRFMMKALAIINQVFIRSLTSKHLAKGTKFQLPYFLIDSCALSLEFRPLNYILSTEELGKAVGFCAHCCKVNLVRVIDLQLDVDIVSSVVERVSLKDLILETENKTKSVLRWSEYILKLFEEQKVITMQYAQFTGWLFYR